MLLPKKVKFRKQQRGRMCGKAWRGSDLSFGDFGLKVQEWVILPTARSRPAVSR